MNNKPILPSRRALLRTLALGAAAFATPGAFAEELLKTPRQSEGPFYPDKLPLDTDNDLIVVNDGLTPAVGEITHLSGRLLDRHGNPLRNAVIEIWQADVTGAYVHTKSAEAHPKRDTHFQGFGRFLTGSTGEYYFRTIKPTAYVGRTPHIHVKVKRGGKELLTTECYIKGEPKNATDGVFNTIKDPQARERVQVAFVPLKGSTAGELTAHFDLVLEV